MTNDRIPLPISAVLTAVAGILAVTFGGRTSVLIPVGSAYAKRVTFN